MKRLKPPIDKTKYKVFDRTEYSDFQRKKKQNNPTHFTLELQENGMDKVTYYIKKLPN